MTDRLKIFSIDPGTFTATLADSCQAGMFMKATGTTEITQTTAIDTADLILVDRCDGAGDEDTCVGVSLASGSDGDFIGIVTQGVFEFKTDSTNGAILAGSSVQKSGTTDAYEIELYDAADGAKIIGTALTPASADDEYAVVLMVMGGAINA